MIVPCPWYFGRVYIIVGKIVKQSRAAIADLTNDQGVSMVVRTHICHFKAVKQASAATVDLWITSRWVAGTVMWSHRSQQINFIGWH
jgi:ribosomal protein S2